VVTDPLFKQYLKERLEHLNPEEKAVMEPVLRKNWIVFHQEGNIEF
jgi:hypothetical protein